MVIGGAVGGAVVVVGLAVACYMFSKRKPKAEEEEIETSVQGGVEMPVHKSQVYIAQKDPPKVVQSSVQGIERGEVHNNVPMHDDSRPPPPTQPKKTHHTLPNGRVVAIDDL